MICPKCKIDVTPIAMQRGLRCPQCWGILPNCSNRTTIRTGLPVAAKRMLNIDTACGYYDLSFDYYQLMRKFDLLYYYEPRSHGGWFQRDTVVKFEEKIVVQVVVAATIITLLVVNEVFDFINY